MSNEKVLNDLKRNEKSQRRIKQLAAMGINVENFFSVVENNHDILMVKENGVNRKIADFGIVKAIEAAADIESAIRESGNIEVAQLYRRWVMAQLFRLMTDSNGYFSSRTFDDSIRRRGMKYAIKMLLEESRVMMLLEARDPAVFCERKLFFSPAFYKRFGDLLRDTFNGIINRSDSHHYVPGYGCMNDSTYARFRRGINSAIDALCADNSTYSSIHAAMTVIQSYRKAFKYTHVYDAFIKTYKDSGAYYTMKNMILFHGCVFTGLNRDESIDHIKSNAVLVNRNLFNDLLTLVHGNNFNFKSRMQEIYSRR